MSRLGKLPIQLTGNAQAKIESGFIYLKGPKGELKQKLHPLVDVKVGEGAITVDVKNKEVKKEKAFWGLYWSLIRNMAKGVTDGYERKMEINGVGYRAAMAGDKINLNLGFSHPVVFDLPAGVTGKVEANIITLNGIDKQLLGETCARIRKIRTPEPYKGKGIKYMEEVIRRKEGKTSGKGSK